MTSLDLSGNKFGQTTGAVDYIIAEGLGRNSTLLKIDLSRCSLGDDGVSTLAHALRKRRGPSPRTAAAVVCGNKRSGAAVAAAT
jgi:hypothetical protein